MEEKAKEPNSLPNHDKPSKKSIAALEASKKKSSTKADLKDEGPKNSRDLYSFKDLYAQQSSMRESIRGQELLHREKSINRPGEPVGHKNPLTANLAKYSELIKEIGSQHKNLPG